MKYAFILGRNLELSLAELGAFFGSALDGQLEVAKKCGAVFFEGELPATFGKPQAAQAFLNRLGGYVEIVEIFEENVAEAEVGEAVEKYLSKKWAGQTVKCNFAINALPERKKSSVLRMLLPRVKKTLRAAGVKANFMNNNFENVSAVFAFKQGLANSGTNISIIERGGATSLGFSVALQDFEGYSARDYSKPFRDARVGMLPPKLAQMMVNLATGGAAGGIGDDTKSVTIVDPFCGTGTLLMEAMLAGHKVIGADSDARMIAGAEKNIAWLREKFHLPTTVKSSLFAIDAQTLHLEEKNIAIATEPHMGPALTRLPAPDQLEKNIKQLEQLYMDFFKNIASWLPAGTPVVFIFPYFKGHANAKTLVSERIIDKITALGYSKAAFVPLQTTSLFYDRADSIVGREIVRFVKN